MSEAVWQCSRPYLSWEETCSSQIVVTTFSMARTLRRWVDFDENLFTHIFIDEGGQATEPEALQAVACAGPHTCLIIAGDHKQMHSASSSLFAEECGQEVQSLLRRPVFYERDISAQTFRGPCRGHFRPLHFIHVEAAEAHLGQDSYGCSNEAEVAKVMEVAESLHSGGEKNVGVISSELSQVWLLQRRRRSHNVGYLDVQRILHPARF
ncbi:helz [Symbiodinium sp. CCMP2592]|nr:helz [Symbiodinium sp. CCMP2592]